MAVQIVEEVVPYYKLNESQVSIEEEIAKLQDTYKNQFQIVADLTI